MHQNAHLDDDCDGTADNDAEGMTLFYADQDQDGFGDERTSQLACTAGARWADNALDCDDSRDDVNPDADEVCGDGVDNDCDDEIDEEACTESGCSTTGIGGSAVWLLGLPLLWRRRRG